MGNVDDVQNYGAKYDNQLKRLRSAHIPEADREAIQSFIRHEDVSGQKGTGTIISHLNRLRLSSERWDRPITEVEGPDELDDLRFILKHDHGMSEGTIRNYEKAWRVFYTWRDEEWAEDVRIRPSPKREVDPNKLLTEDDIDSLLETAGNSRDKAAIALLADTGL
ncbi:MAG: integrase, partial [Halodesulfurarchaeum sp.]